MSCRQIQGACRRGCAPPSFLFLSSLRTRGSSVVLFAKTGKSKDPGSSIESGMTEVFPHSVILGACRRGCAPPSFLFLSSLPLFLSSSTLVIEDPVSLSLSFLGHPCAIARIQCRSLRKDRKKQRPWIPDRVGDDRRENASMAPNPGRLQARLRPSVISFSVILAHARIQYRCFCLCLSSFCHPRRLVIEDPVSLSLSFLFCHPCAREDPVSFSSQRQEEAKTLDPRSSRG